MRLRSVSLDTILLANAAGDARLEVECARLSGEAYALAKRPELAFESGVLGLKALAPLSADRVPKESAAELGKFLMRLTEQRAVKHYSSGVEQQMARLLGVGWDRAAV